MPQPQPRRKGPTITTTMRFPKSILDAADRRAADQDVSRTHHIVNLIEQDARANPKRRRKPPPDATPRADVFG